MDDKNEEVAVDLPPGEETEESETETDETTDWEVRAKKLEEQAIAQLQRTRA